MELSSLVLLDMFNKSYIESALLKSFLNIRLIINSLFILKNFKDFKDFIYFLQHKQALRISYSEGKFHLK